MVSVFPEEFVGSLLRRVCVGDEDQIGTFPTQFVCLVPGGGRNRHISAITLLLEPLDERSVQCTFAQRSAKMIWWLLPR